MDTHNAILLVLAKQNNFTSRTIHALLKTENSVKKYINANGRKKASFISLLLSRTTLQF